MHPDFERSDRWTREVIGAAIEVHRDKGPGLIESIYERCFLRELELRRIPFETQIQAPISYKGITFDAPLRLDLLVDRCLSVELKAVEAVLPIHKAQLMSYMKLLNTPIGLLINFHEVVLKDGIHRFILPGSNSV